MSTMTVAAGLALALATSFCLAYAGDVTRRRPLAGHDQLAGRMFAVWWFSAALVILNQAVRTLMVLAGITDVAAYEVQGTIGMVPLAGAVWGLTYYMAYLLTGRRAWFVPVTGFYLAYLLFLFYFQVRHGVAGVSMGEWQALVTNETPPSSTMNLVFGLWLALPVFFAVGAFFILAVTVSDPTRRYRLSLISGGFLLLFGIVLVGYIAGWVNESWFPLAYTIPSLLASILAVAAYRPPLWVQQRYGIEPVPSGPLL